MVAIQATRKEKTAFLTILRKEGKECLTSTANLKACPLTMLFSIVVLRNGETELRLRNELDHIPSELLAVNLDAFLERLRQKKIQHSITDTFPEAPPLDKGILDDILDAVLACSDIFDHVETLPVLIEGSITRQYFSIPKIQYFIDGSLSKEKIETNQAIVEMLLRNHQYFRELLDRDKATLTSKKNNLVLSKSQTSKTDQSEKFQVPLRINAKIEKTEFKDLKEITHTPENSKKITPFLKKFYLDDLFNPKPVNYKSFHPTKTLSYVIIKKKIENAGQHEYLLEFRISNQDSHTLAALDEKQVKSKVETFYENYQLNQLIQNLMVDETFTLTDVEKKDLIYTAIANSSLIEGCPKYPVVAAGELRLSQCNELDIDGVLNDNAGAFYLDADRKTFIQAINKFDFLRKVFMNAQGEPNEKVKFVSDFAAQKVEPTVKTPADEKIVKTTSNSHLYFFQAAPSACVDRGSTAAHQPHYQPMVQAS